MTLKLRGLCVLAAVVGVSALGCDGRTASSGNSISGAITYKGARVKGGAMFFHQQGKAFPANINPDGSYTASGLPAGEFKVTIDTRSLKGAASPEAMVKQVQEEAAKQGKTMPATGAAGISKEDMQKANNTAASRYVAIPQKYADLKTSPLTATIASGSESKDFDLTD